MEYKYINTYKRRERLRKITKGKEKGKERRRKKIKQKGEKNNNKNKSGEKGKGKTCCKDRKMESERE